MARKFLFKGIHLLFEQRKRLRERYLPTYLGFTVGRSRGSDISQTIPSFTQQEFVEINLGRENVSPFDTRI